MSILLKAIDFATKRHKGQTRLYTKEPYIVHPVSVSYILSNVTDDKDILVAGICHDLLEDTDTTVNELVKLFGPRVASFVVDVTDISQLSDGNRKVRKELDRKHLAKAQPQSKTIKLADIIDNAKDLITHDPGFAKKWMGEKRTLLPDLIEGDAKLYKQAESLIKIYMKTPKVK